MRTTPIVLAVAGALSLSAPAVAQSPAVSFALKPNTTSSATRLTLSATGGDGSALAGRTPQSIAVNVQRGATLDPLAVADRCTLDQAKTASCPDGSKIGNGTADLHIVSALGSFDDTATLRVDLGAPAQAGDIASVLLGFTEPMFGQKGAAQGRVVKLPSGTYGLELRFDGLDGAGALPAGTTVSLNSLALGVSTSRTVKGKRHALLTTPSRCSGTSFVGQATVTFASGDPLVQPLTTPCVQKKKKPAKKPHHRPKR